MSVRAKFTVQEVTRFSYSDSATRVKLSAVCADEVEENQRYHRYTPSGSIELTIDNPPASAVFAPGRTFYVDFTEVAQVGGEA
jgi:hypothetical protein